MDKAVTWYRQNKARIFFTLAVPLALCSVQRAQAQDFPAKPITVIIPFGPGGHSDLVTRPLSAVAQKYLGQPLVVEMKPGGQGIIGTEHAAKSAPDGYTLLATGVGWNAALPAIEGRSYGPDQLEPVVMLSEESTFLTVRADSPYKTLKDLVTYVKANPGKVTVGIGGPYTTSETFWRWMTKTQGASVRLVKFGGGSQMMLAGLGGHVDVFGGSPLSVSEQARAGKIKPLVYYGEKRHPEYPDVPTAREEGFDIALEIWNGYAAPKGTPRPVIDKLAEAIRKMLDDPAVKEAYKQAGEHVTFLGPDEYRKVWRETYDFYADMKGAYSIKGIVDEAKPAN
ncbi:Bug family tripartite tricarboxylate transporter substrate binding protein [Microvirga zambiensis]|uniref:Bug family tripartite tricarboxylate transporter substrate binding protein n=1 Tax=Microvirga zambiensis TaxID=1402137 RepID=UPI00191E40EA|nr:tripartite tricarboxylate transporter substrate binding protein [Microvirga zambiensis]